MPVFFVVRRFDAQKCGKDYYDVTVTKCLWHTACVENGCENPYRLFCDADDVTCGRLRKTDFTRTKTFGYDGDRCDFRFSESSGRLT